MRNFGIIEVTTTKSISAPGWAYVPDNGPQTPLTASQPVSRKRARKPVFGVFPEGNTILRDAKLLRELALLDRENHREVAVPIPPKQRSEHNTCRGSHSKTTGSVRKILQSNKTFANYLADSEAAQTSSAVSNSSGSTFYTTSTPTQLVAPVSRVTPTAGSTDTAKRSLSQRRSSKRRNANDKNVGELQRGSVPVTRKISSVSQAYSPTEVKRMERQQSKRNMPILETALPPLSPGTINNLPITPDALDYHPLLISWIPVMPSKDELRRLLAHPPLSYVEAWGPLVEEDRKKHARFFCERCGYWAKVMCVKCGCRVCNLDCYKEHKEECDKYGP